MFLDDIIEKLLQKKASLREDLEREYAERDALLDELLSKAGYVPPVVEEVDAQSEAAADAAESVTANGQW